MWCCQCRNAAGVARVMSTDSRYYTGHLDSAIMQCLIHAVFQWLSLSLPSSLCWPTPTPTPLHTPPLPNTTHRHTPQANSTASLWRECASATWGGLVHRAGILTWTPTRSCSTALGLSLTPTPPAGAVALRRTIRRRGCTTCLSASLPATAVRRPSPTPACAALEPQTFSNPRP
jgi:hypothetical protein